MSLVLTQVTTQSSPYKIPSAVTPVPCRHTFHISTRGSTLGQGAFIFSQSRQYHRQKNRRVSRQGKLSGCELYGAPLGCADSGTGDFSLIGSSERSATEMCTKTSTKFSKVGYCHSMYTRQRLEHILISSRKGGVHFQDFQWPSVFPRHCKELFKLSLCYTHGEFFPHKPSSVTQRSLDKIVSLWFGCTMLICI